MRCTAPGWIVRREQFVERLNDDPCISRRSEQPASVSVRAIYGLEVVLYGWPDEAQKRSHLFASPSHFVDGLVGANGRWVIEERDHLGGQFAEYPLDALIDRLVEPKPDLP
jgi:hypothetical protein